MLLLLFFPLVVVIVLFVVVVVIVFVIVTIIIFQLQELETGLLETALLSARFKQSDPEDPSSGSDPVSDSTKVHGLGNLSIVGRMKLNIHEQLVQESGTLVNPYKPIWNVV